MKNIFIAFFTIAIFSSCSNGSMGCDNAIEASLVQVSDIPGCEWAFISEDYDRPLEPINLTDYITDPEESKSYMIEFDEKPDAATICQTGILIELTCLE